MPVFRSFYCKIKPGRMQDAATQVATLKRLSMEAGARACAAYNVVTGPLFPGLTIHIVSDDLPAYGATRDKILANPEAAQFFAEDAPIAIVNSLLAESVYEAGPPVGDIHDQMTVRINTVHKPHVGREADVVRRLSHFADAGYQSGALTAVVRRVIAGTEGPRVAVFGYFTDWEHMAKGRAALRETDVWNALNQSQDEVSTDMGVTISTKLVI